MYQYSRSKSNPVSQLRLTESPRETGHLDCRVSRRPLTGNERSGLTLGCILLMRKQNKQAHTSTQHCGGVGNQLFALPSPSRKSYTSVRRETQFYWWPCLYWCRENAKSSRFSRPVNLNIAQTQREHRQIQQSNWKKTLDGWWQSYPSYLTKPTALLSMGTRRMLTRSTKAQN